MKKTNHEQQKQIQRYKENEENFDYSEYLEDIEQ